MNFSFFYFVEEYEVLIVLLAGIPELHNKEQQKVFGELSESLHLFLSLGQFII
jgi:hypothetical protein